MKYICTISFDILVEAPDALSAVEVAKHHAQAEAAIVPAKALGVISAKPKHDFNRPPVGWDEDDEPLTLLVQSDPGESRTYGP